MATPNNPATMTHFTNRPRPDVIAEVRFFLPEEGGRKGEVLSGYRCPIDIGAEFDGKRILNDVELIFLGDSRLPLGEVRHAHIRFLVPELQFGRLNPGQRFALHEGAIVGHGEVLEVLDSRMIKAPRYERE